LWTELPEGEKVTFSLYDNEYQEADYAIRTIAKGCEEEGRSYHDFAILYRTNAQSRIFEEKLLLKNIPYKIIGGQNFYGRKEVKDLICYLKAVDNGRDNMAIRRIVNVPKRGIGAASIDKIQAYADTYEMSLLDAMFEASNVPGLNRAAAKVEGFTNLIMDLRDMLSKGAFISEVFDAILERTGYWEELVAEHTDEAEGRMENLTELKNKIVTYEQEAEHPNLSELLEEIALVAEVDSLDDREDKVLLMTLHSAKGLEFPVVLLGGMEDNLFPSKMSLISEDEDAVEEERRLCYVGITRAKERLYMSAARQRMMHGASNYNPVSRFIKEIPEDVIQINGDGAFAMRRQQAALEEARSTKEALGASVSSKPYSYGSNVGKSGGAGGGKPYSFSGGKPAFGKEFKIEPLKIDYQVGDRVRHVKFGNGVVTELVSGGKDYEVTVDFENVGVKRMFASFAKLKKI
jgi:DNA helicase-2/ATP-dependent DNA helicase PcrA